MGRKYRYDDDYGDYVIGLRVDEEIREEEERIRAEAEYEANIEEDTE